MRIAIAVLLVLLPACAGTRSTPARDGKGAIAGLARDHDSGDPVAKADIQVFARGDLRGVRTTTNDHGLYDLDDLPPGRYLLRALFTGQPVDIVNIDVRPNDTTYVDILFTLGRPEPLRVEYGDRAGAIDRYRPRAG